MKFTTLMLGAAMMLCVQQASADSAANFGKGYAGVEVRVAASAQGAPGKPVDVQIDYIASPQTGPVEVAYATEGGLTLKSPARRQLSPDSSGVSHDTVAVQASSTGAYFLNLFVTTSRGSNAISIPVMVGGVMLKPQGASSVATPNGQRVIEMPAQENRR